jgi:WD40 repeat protein
MYTMGTAMKTWKPTPVHMIGIAVISSVGLGALAWGPAEQKDRLLRGHHEWVSSAVFTPDGRGVISGAGNHELTSETKHWAVMTGGARELAGHTGSVEAIAFSPDGQQMATGGYDQMIRLWNVTDGYKPICTLPGHDAAIRLLAYSPDGRTLISAGADHIIRFWDCASGSERSRLEGCEVLALSPQSDSFVSREIALGKIAIRDLTTGEIRRSMTVNDKWTMCAAFSPDGQSFAAGGFNAIISVYPLKPAGESTLLSGHQDYIIAVAFSPDGRFLASASQDRTVKLWDLGTGQEIRTLVGHTGPVTSVAFAPGGKRLVSGSYDKSVRIWNLEDLK